MFIILCICVYVLCLFIQICIKGFFAFGNSFTNFQATATKRPKAFNKWVNCFLLDEENDKEDDDVDDGNDDDESLHISTHVASAR